MFRSTCPLCIAAGLDVEAATFEHEDAEEHAEEFNAHVAADHNGLEKKNLNPDELIEQVGNNPDDRRNE